MNNTNDEPERRSLGNLRPFTKGDPRINRSGRPKSFDELRKLAQKIMGETLLDPDGNSTITVAEAILRRLAKSNEPVANRIVLEYAYGKVPDKIETNTLDGRTVIELHYAHERPEIEAAERAKLERRKALSLKPPS